jgi:hypothetical protein
VTVLTTEKGLTLSTGPGTRPNVNRHVVEFSLFFTQECCETIAKISARAQVICTAMVAGHCLRLSFCKSVPRPHAGYEFGSTHHICIFEQTNTSIM